MKVALPNYCHAEATRRHISNNPFVMLLTRQHSRPRNNGVYLERTTTVHPTPGQFNPETAGYGQPATKAKKESALVSCVTYLRNTPVCSTENLLAKMWPEMSPPTKTAAVNPTSRRKLKLKWRAFESPSQSRSSLTCELMFSAVYGSDVAQIDERLTFVSDIFQDNRSNRACLIREADMRERRQQFCPQANAICEKTLPHDFDGPRVCRRLGESCE